MYLIQCQYPHSEVHFFHLEGFILNVQLVTYLFFTYIDYR